jgi:drug/metabolite transporter (DMT)-like permease
MNRAAYRAELLLMCTAIIWGTAFVAQRVGMDYVGPHTFNGVRFLLGSLVLLPFALRKPNHHPGRTKLPGFMQSQPLLWGGLLAGLLLFAGAALQQIGLVYTTAAKAAFITGLYVIIVPFLGLFWGHRVHLNGWLGAVLAVIGLYLLSIKDDFSIELGDLLELIGAFFWAGHILMLAWLSPRMEVLRLATAQFVACSAFSLITALIFEEISLTGLWGGALAIFYGGAVSVGIAYTLQVVAQKHAPPFAAAIILSMETVVAAVAGWLILDEVLTFRAGVGCALMLAGMIIAQVRMR